MASRLRHVIGYGLARFRWPIAGLAALVLVLACVLVIPQWLVGWELGASARTLAAADRARAINDIRATLLQGIGGAVILLGAGLTYRQLQTGREQLHVAQQGQVTERFTRAIDQLGHPELDVRLGGIYALERIANDSADDRATIAEVLTAYVRGHAPWPPRLPGQYVADAPIRQVPELQIRAPDVQAALTVLARGGPQIKARGRLDLHATDLRKADLAGANLQGAHLEGASLQGADLLGAQLQGADLRGAQLQRARLRDAQLQDASLSGANLRKASLMGASLQRARLRDAKLQVALLTNANLRAADLTRAKLQGASLLDAQLEEANLSGVQLQEANLCGANFQRASLLDALLTNADADPKTLWPTGFDPRRAGVVIDREADVDAEPVS